MASASPSLPEVWENDTARGPLSAIKFVLTLSMALSGMTVLPSFKWGVTSTDSHLIGACGDQLQVSDVGYEVARALAAEKISLTD